MSDLRAPAEQDRVIAKRIVFSHANRGLEPDVVVKLVERELRGVRDAERQRAAKIARECFGFPVIAKAIEGADHAD